MIKTRTMKFRSVDNPESIDFNLPPNLPDKESLKLLQRKIYI